MELEPTEIRLLFDPPLLREFAILLWPLIYSVMLFLYFLIYSNFFILFLISSFIWLIFYSSILLFVDKFIFFKSSVEWFKLLSSLLLRFIFYLLGLLFLFSFLWMRLLIYWFFYLLVRSLLVLRLYFSLWN